MLKKYKKTLIVTTILLLLPMLFGILIWDRLPAEVPMHWNIRGEVDDSGSRAMLVFFLPLFLLAMQWVCVLATAADPKNRKQAEKPVRLVFWLVPVISLITHGMSYAAALGVQVAVQRFLVPLLGIVFLLIGNYLPKCRRNYTIGIKLPWTLHDDENWTKTHRLAGILWMVGGVLLLPTALLPATLSFAVLMAMVLTMTLIPTVYSYRLYRASLTEEDAEQGEETDEADA